MPRGGRYRAVRVALWADPEFQALSANAKLTFLALSTGSHSNLAGISFLSLDTLQRETLLSREETEAALAELEKRPSPARSFIMRDASPVVWVRNLLRDDPSREKDDGGHERGTDVRNKKHRTAIETILGSLPKASPVVRKFRVYYNFLAHRVSDRVSDTPSHTPYDSRILEPETETGDGNRRGESARGERGDGSPLAPPSGSFFEENGNNKTRTTYRKPSRGEYQECLDRIRREYPHLSAQEAEKRAYDLFDAKLRQ